MLYNILKTNLILTPPPDVPADIYLLLSNVLLANKVIELLHGSVDDILNSQGDLHVQHQSLVFRQLARRRACIEFLCIIIYVDIVRIDLENLR